MIDENEIVIELNNAFGSVSDYNTYQNYELFTQIYVSYLPILRVHYLHQHCCAVPVSLSVTMYFVSVEIMVEPSSLFLSNIRKPYNPAIEYINGNAQLPQVPYFGKISKV